MQHRFTPTTLLITGGLLIWMTNFMFVYVFAAVACARGFAHLRLVSLPIIPVVTTVATLLAGAVTIGLVRQGVKRLGAPAGDEHTRFIGFVTLATSGIALVALILLALPPLLVVACDRP